MTLPTPSFAVNDFGSLSALTDEALFGACGVRIMFTGRAGGVSEGHYASLNTASHVGDDPARVSTNRRLVLEAADAADVPFIVPNQVHGTSIACVADAGDVARVEERAAEGVDGIVVQVPQVAVLMNFADCLSLIVVSPSGRFAVAHAGWRGAVQGIAGKAVRALAEGDAHPPREYNAYLGPHIRSECFEVGEDVADRFTSAFGGAVATEFRHVSLARAVSADLVRAGVLHERIADSGICTKCHPNRYFSYRATDAACGRHAAFAVRK